MHTLDWSCSLTARAMSRADLSDKCSLRGRSFRTYSISGSSRYAAVAHVDTVKGGKRREERQALCPYPPCQHSAGWLSGAAAYPETLTQPYVPLTRLRASLSAATTTRWRCARRAPLGGIVWPRRQRPPPAHSGSQKRGAWRWQQ